MVCPSCVMLAPLAIGLGLSINESYYIGSLLTILSLCLYLYYKEFKNCEECNIKNK